MRGVRQGLAGVSTSVGERFILVQLMDQDHQVRVVMTYDEAREFKRSLNENLGRVRASAIRERERSSPSRDEERKAQEEP